MRKVKREKVRTVVEKKAMIPVDPIGKSLRTGKGNGANRSDLYEEALELTRRKKYDRHTVLEKLRFASEMGDDRAIYALATWYLFGENVEKDYIKAAELLVEAVNLGNTDAMFDLAISYEKGFGVEADERKAFLLYLEAALRGNVSAIYEVSRCYWYSIGVNKDEKVANLFYDRAIDLGYEETDSDRDDLDEV